MSFLQSNLTTGSFSSISFSGPNGIASSQSNAGIYYSSNLGQSWNRANYNNGLQTAGDWGQVILSGSVGFALNNSGASGLGIYYTIDYGTTWTQSTDVTFGKWYAASLSGSNGIAGSISGNGIYYTTNSGKNWKRATLTTGGVTNNNFISVALSGTNGIASSYSNLGLYYTTNGGKTWTQSPTVTNGNFTTVSLSGNNGIAGSLFVYPLTQKSGIYYTTDGGQTWAQSNINNNSFYSVFLIGNFGVAGSSAQYGLYYTKDGGQNWSQSDIITTGGSNTKGTGSFNSVFLSGSFGIAGSFSGTGLYITKDSGKTWFQSSTVTTGNFNSLYIDPSSLRGIAGSSSNKGIYYSEKNELILNQEKKNVDQLIDKTNQEKRDIETKLIVMEKSTDNTNPEQEYNNNIERNRLEEKLEELKKRKEILDAYKLSLSARNSEASILLSDKNRLLATVNSNIQQKYTKLEDVNEKINTITQNIYTNNLEMKRKENIIQTLKVIIIIVVIMAVILMIYFGMEYVETNNPGLFQNFTNTIYV